LVAVDLIELAVIAERRTFMFRTTLAVIGLLAAAVVASAQPRPDTGNAAVDQAPTQFRYRGPTTADDPLYRRSPSERRATRWHRHAPTTAAVPMQGPIPNQVYAACLPEARLFAGSRLTIEDLRDYIATHPQCANRAQFSDASIPKQENGPRNQLTEYTDCMLWQTSYYRGRTRLYGHHDNNSWVLPADPMFQAMLAELTLAIRTECLAKVGLQQKAGGGLEPIPGGK
jgi:hypothetical protein